MDASTSRNLYFDNLKGGLIVLVVLAHSLEAFLGTPSLKFLYIAIYAFHMPLFIFCSGYFSASNTPAKILKYIVFPYIIFQTLYCLFYLYVLKSDQYGWNYLLPIWLLWYLFALIFWNLLLLLFRFLGKRSALLAVAAAFALGILVGFLEFIQYGLSLSRVFVFFPFFLMGYYFRQFSYTKETLHRKWPLIISCAVILLFLAGTGITLDQFPVNWVYGAKSYAQAGASWLIRPALYAVALAFSYVFLFLTPVCKTMFSGLGRRCLPVYLLHGFVIKTCAHLGFYSRLDALVPSVFMKLIILLSGAVLLTCILSSRSVYKAACLLCKPDWLPIPRPK